MILHVVSRLISVAEMALFIYVILSYIMPNHDITRLLYRIIEPILKPIRRLLYRYFPQLMRVPFDFSLIVLYLAFGLLRTILFAIF